jgi:pimeloyl-ACP methyl ester carboxylesterase
MSQEVCNSVSLATCPAHFGPITLAEALHRFQREAVTGLCDTGRYRCPFFSWGDGPTLVCIPGLADDSKSFVQPLALLSRHFRCVAYDWPTGNDGARLSGYHHGDFVEDLFAVLDHVGAGQAFPLGYSFGSTVALAALHARPERFPRAVLLGGFARRPLAPAEELLASWARYWQGAMDRVPHYTRRPVQWCRRGYPCYPRQGRLEGTSPSTMNRRRLTLSGLRGQTDPPASPAAA